MRIIYQHQKIPENNDLLLFKKAAFPVKEDRNAMQAAESNDSAGIPEGYISTEEAAAAQRSMAMKMIFGGGLLLCIFALVVLYRQRKKMEIS